MRLSKAFTMLCLTAVCLALIGCSPGKKATAPTANGGHSAASAFDKFPPLKDRSIVDAAAEALKERRSVRVLMHVTQKKDSTLTVAEDSEILLTAEGSSAWNTQETMTGKRRFLTRTGSDVYASSDSVKWSKETTNAGTYGFEPSDVAKMLKDATSFRLVGSGRPVDWSKAATVVEFERPSTLYPGKIQQVVAFIDEQTRLVVRLEVLDDWDKPKTFTETFYRYSDYDSPQISVTAPKV